MTAQRPSHLGDAVHDSPLSFFARDEQLVPSETQWPQGIPPRDMVLFEKAGPRRKLFFEPSSTRAAIVTCGGLCPGLNNVIRSVTRELRRGYGVGSVLGIRGGYRGLDPARGKPPLELTDEVVEDIHKEGGTLLGTSRGPVDMHTAVDFLMAERVNILFTV
ncbi:MAG: 6-phosphofructokinase, partial [Burkholderiaceae bacterium]|nr:6-phosphofructokinase [Burkholderiaceae bacterium]